MTDAKSAQAALADPRGPDDELRRHAEWLRITLGSVGDAVVTTDPVGRVMFMNERAEVLTGWTQRDAHGRELRDIVHVIHESDRRPVDSPVARTLHTGELVRSVDHVVLRARNGKEFPVEESAAPIWNQSGGTVGAVVVFRDISDRKLAELERAHLAAIIADSDDAIVSKTLRGVILTWNGGAERLFGYGAQEAVGRPITMLIPPERLQEEIDILARIVRGDRVEHFETVRIAKDGRHLDISLTVSPIRNAAGEIIGASKIARDITGRKAAEAALREADQQKDRFIALLAHELRNPLAPLRNALQVMRIAPADGEAVQAARRVMERQLAHMVRLIDDLLDISRIAQNKLALRRARVPLAEVIAAAVETARPAIDAAGHSLTVSLPGEPVFVDGDLTRLSQVFGNLLGNSAKFTERGGVLRVTAERRDREIVVSVQDNGIGIPPHALVTIFDMFAQVDRRVEQASGGLGIGLALVKGVVAMHGGTVTASSGGPGQGSTFTVTLPESDAAPPPSTDVAGPARKSTSRPSRRILVVDDNRDGADTMAYMLQLMGNEVRIAYRGEDALRLVEEFRPQLVFMDIGMPDIDGFEVTRQIRQQAWGRDITIVALTGWGNENDRKRSLLAGCDRHLVKPVDEDVLDALLAGLSDNRARLTPLSPS